MTDNLKEREAFEAFLLGKYGKVYSKEDVDRFIEHGHVCWLTWQGRAAIAHQSGVPADEVEAMAEEVARLQKALAFWMPDVPSENHSLYKRVANDVYLLVGCDGPNPEPSAFELGHVVLAASPQPQPVHPTFTTDEIEAALPAMREYARKNPKHHFSTDGTEQDPNGVHAWLERNDKPRTEVAQAKPEQAEPIPAQPVHPSDQWRPIETAPKDGAEIIMSNGKDVSAGSWLKGHDGTYDRDGAPNCDEKDACWMDWSGGMLPEPTHWMPLPPAPQPKD